MAPHGDRQHSRRLCIVVDDFALHSGVCQAALDLLERERVHAIGCMVGTPSWALWAPRLKAHRPGQVDLGLHLDLTEHPLRLPPRSVQRLLVMCGMHLMPPAAVRAEVRAQLDAFEQHTGRAPAFVDGHQHVHQLPVVREALVAELAWRYAGSLPWLRNTQVASGMVERLGWRAALKARCIAALGSAGLTACARPLGFRQNAHLLGVHDFSADEARYLQLLQGWLLACRQGDLLMCHPSLSHQARDALSSARLTEYRVIAGAAFGALLRDQGIELQALSRTLAE